MKDDNSIRFEPDETRSRAANPLGIRQELNRHALTKNLVLFDEFSQRIILNRPVPRPGLKMPKTFEPRPWEDTDAIALIEHLNARGFKRVGRETVHDVILLEARTHGFHPVRDYLEGLQWDGVQRLDRFLLDFCGAVIEGATETQKAQHETYISAVTRAFFISGVARIMSPGCKVDATLILEGEQGSLKSSLLRALAVNDSWFSDSLPHDLASKDARQHLAGVWIVELSEIAQLRRSEVESLKNYLSCQIDRYRPPYARFDVAVPRQNIFIGTTNAEVYLHDTTGNRRFWPVKITTIRLAEARMIVDQLWAEAVDAWRKKEKWWLPDRIEKIAAAQQEGRLERDPWFEDVARFVDSRIPGGWITTADVFGHLDVDISRRDRSHEMRVGTILREIGCERQKRWVGGTTKTRWAYRVPDEKEEDDDPRSKSL
jgi:predicted P-loop ATPase